jgi:hypothetical protein
LSEVLGRLRRPTGISTASAVKPSPAHVPQDEAKYDAYAHSCQGPRPTLLGLSPPDPSRAAKTRVPSLAFRSIRELCGPSGTAAMCAPILPSGRKIFRIRTIRPGARGTGHPRASRTIRAAMAARTRSVRSAVTRGTKAAPPEPCHAAGLDLCGPASISDNGKPTERWGRKATGLKRDPMGSRHAGWAAEEVSMVAFYRHGSPLGPSRASYFRPELNRCNFGSARLEPCGSDRSALTCEPTRQRPEGAKSPTDPLRTRLAPPSLAVPAGLTSSGIRSGDVGLTADRERHRDRPAAPAVLNV